MKFDYRKALADNLRALLAFNGSDVLKKAIYVDGTKKGDPISARTVRYVLSGADGVSALGLDGLAALANAFGMEPYHLLVPGLDPTSHPTTHAESWIEGEVQRRLNSRLRRAKPLLNTTEAKDAKRKKRPAADHPWPHLETPTKHGKRKATKGSAKVPARRRTTEAK